MAPTPRSAKDVQATSLDPSSSQKLMIPIETWQSNVNLIKTYFNPKECELRLQPGDIPGIKLIMNSYSATVREKLSNGYRQDKQEFITVKLGPLYQVDSLKTCIDAMHTGKLEVSTDRLQGIILTLQNLDITPMAFSQIASALTGQHSAMGRLVSVEVLLVLMEALHTSLEASGTSMSLPTDSEKRQMKSTLFALAIEIARKLEEDGMDIARKILPHTSIIHWYYLCAICTENFVRNFSLQRDFFPYAFFDPKSRREFMHQQIVYRDAGTKQEPTKEKTQVTFSVARQKMFLWFTKWSVDKPLDTVYKSPSPIDLIHLAKLTLTEVSQCFWEFCSRKDMKLHRPFLAALGAPSASIRMAASDVATPDVTQQPTDNAEVSWLKVVNSQAAPSKKRASWTESSDADSDGSSEEPSSVHMKKVQSSVQEQVAGSSKVSTNEAGAPRSKSTVKKKRSEKTKKSVQTP